MPEKIEVILNYVDKSFEEGVLRLLPTKTKKIKKGRNQIIRFGSKVPYDNNVVSDIIPDLFYIFGDSIPFNSVTINEYLEGDEIKYHIDKIGGGDKIYIISLVSDTKMYFKKKGNSSEVVEFYLPRFSLTIISEELRYEWKHSVKVDSYRVSVVFRNSELV